MSSPRTSSLVALACALTSALVVTPASAYRDGNTYAQTTGQACARCHEVGTAPTVSITSEGPYLEGRNALFTITVTSHNGEGAGRFAAFAASTDGAGRFVDGADYERDNGGCNNRVRDVTRRSFEAGSYTWTLELIDLMPGAHTLRVGGNDVDGDDEDEGDSGGAATFSFTVEPASMNDEVPSDGGALDGGSGDGGAGNGGILPTPSSCRPPPPPDAGPLLDAGSTDAGDLVDGGVGADAGDGPSPMMCACGPSEGDPRGLGWLALWLCGVWSLRRRR